MKTFQPTMLGFTFTFQDEEGEAMITDENERAFYIESNFFTGWMSKADFYSLYGSAE